VGGVVLRLEVLDFAGPTKWRFRLTDAVGGFVADHLVELDSGEWQSEAFWDLHTYLRWNAVPDRRSAHEAELVAGVGEWVGAKVLGPVGTALAEGRGPVLLEVPAGSAAVLGYAPWELARVGGRTLAEHRVSFVIDQQPRRPLDKAAVGERLRMLAVFSLPDGAGALNLRKERFELARLVHEIAEVNDKAIELRVLQYGATRARLEDALLEADGWDVVHLSGHGLRAGLVLEKDTGEHDLITSGDLVDLLDLTSGQLKLVTLSACESAAVTAQEHLRLLGLDPAIRDTTGPDQPEKGKSDGGGSLPAVAAALVDRLDCAVLAMRYPVVDDFAIELARSFYGLVLGKGQPVTRALGITLPRVAPWPPTGGAPAISIATPVLFGARAGDLSLVPPAGWPVGLDTERENMAGFPEQPQRFVGRVGPMTRATTALAPCSGRSGVLLHGMAGGGKTACALELAYTHQHSFRLLAWHQAPPEGADIAGALAEFALSLERQLGLKLVHAVTSTDTLREVLPGVTEALEQHRVLIVLDNIESLLTDTGTWRDQRWALLIEALTSHRGLSRLVMTSRRRPTQLSSGVVVEAVHALSLREAVLLARDLPHLGALIDAGPNTKPGQASPQALRELAARALQLVQGHPKLIELVDGLAQDPDALTARLDQADRSWLDADTPLDTFLHTGESAATDTQFLTVLLDWTRRTTATLPEPAAMLFAMLCWTEDDDRLPVVLDANWADLWQRLGKPGQPPGWDTALTPLVDHALVAVETNPDTGQVARFRVHPGLAEAGRTTTSTEFAAAVDTELADYWLSVLSGALEQEHEEMGWLVLRAARSAAPYLLRQHRWDDLNTAAEQLQHRDDSTATAAMLLPMLTTALDATHGATHGADLELHIGRSHARTLAIFDPAQAEARFRQLLDTATAREQFGTASNLAGDLINLYIDRGGLDNALVLVDTKIDYTRRAGYGSWSQLIDQGLRLQILHFQGHSQQVLDEVLRLREQMAKLPDPPEANDTVANPWNVRETMLSLGMLAARDRQRWQQALDLNAENLDSQRRRGASDAEQAFAAFNNYFPLLRLGRASQARELLISCRAVFEATNNITALGKTMSALANVEEELGHRDRSIALETDALRYIYLAADPDAIATSHRNLAIHLHRSGHDSRPICAHRLAAAMITYQTGSGRLAEELERLGELLAAEPDAAPGSFDQLCHTLHQIDGVNLAELLTRLPQRAPDPDTTMTHVLNLAHQARAEREQRLVAEWDPVLSALHTSLHHDDPDTRHAATAALDQTLTARGDGPDWQHLVAVLRRIHAGERDADTLTHGLDTTDTTITRRALDILAGHITLNPDTWHALTPSPADTADESAPALEDFIDAVVDAARGNTQAPDTVTPLLEQMDADPDWAPLANAIRRVIAGDHTPPLGQLNSNHATLLTTILERLATPPSTTNSEQS
jgi:tetratricopeptide (TPR) repeat protein